MSTLTKNYKLIKPDQTDAIDISNLNDNADVIDTTLFNKVDKEEGKVLSTNDYTNEDKEKLNSLSNYIHPDTHLASMIVFEDGETLQEKFNKNTLFTPAETTQP